MFPLRESLAHFLDILYIPENLINRKREFLLHVSDTPSSFYRGLGKLIEQLEPLYLVHSGDIADEIKLALHPGDLELYRRRVLSLASIISKASVELNMKTVFSIGNHDDRSCVLSSFPDSKVIDLADRVEIDRWSFCISHYASCIPDDTSCVGLYGHDIFSFPDNKGCRLNGLKCINLFSIITGEIYHLDYPRYVNNQRQLKRRVSL